MPSNLVRTLIIWVGLVELVISYSASAQPFLQQYPITISENIIYVKVLINNQGPYNFKLDSGVPDIARIDKRLAKDLALNIIGFQRNTAIYPSKTEIVVGVQALKLGQLTYSNLKLTVSDENTDPKQIPIDGIIGRAFFNDYLLTIDGPARQLTVSKETLDAQTKGVFSYNKAFLITGKIGQRNLLFNLDTGSTFAFHFPTSLLVGIQYENTRNKREIVLPNNNFVMQEAVVKDELSIGSVKVADQKVYYSDKAHQISMGEDFLKQHTITLDQRKKLVRID